VGKYSKPDSDTLCYTLSAEKAAQDDQAQSVAQANLVGSLIVEGEILPDE
jgi:hypothetical protein